jgi:peptidoglycan hydrolase-like protein with peptidoglycan-binding domain
MALVAVAVTALAVVLTPRLAGATGWPTVRSGDSGANVTSIQHLLTTRGYGTAADGDFGPNTESRVRAFQSGAGLAVDGIVGTQTWSALVVTVREGDRGDAVRAAQVQLRKHGLGVAVDGVFGGATADAVRTFQGRAGLDRDGIVGPNTWRELTGRSASGGGGGGGSGAYSYVLPAGAVARSELDDPHHDYPAADLPARTGTDAYAVTAGSVTLVGGGCGLGVRIDGDDGAQYTYCHFSSRSVGNGARVSPGQKIGDTGSTGNSTGPHLHFQVRYGGALRCPQRMLLALYDETAVPTPGSLPRTGCYY